MAKLINIVCTLMLILTTSAKLVIQSPLSLRSLFALGEIQSSNSNFGYIPYGHNMVSTSSLSYLACLDWKDLLQ